jgi:nucleotide-binding universal stress UspA family protein
VFTSILCPVDFSPHSERALGYALNLAQLTGARLTIMNVVDSFLDAATAAAGHSEALTRQTQGEMQGLLERISGRGAQLNQAPGIVVVTGGAADQILKQIDECKADVVVMGTQGAEGTKRLVFGSTTEEVLRSSPVPVLAVPMRDREETR